MKCRLKLLATPEVVWFFLFCAVLGGVSLGRAATTSKKVAEVLEPYIANYTPQLHKNVVV
jgi:hypothetical protein